VHAHSPISELKGVRDEIKGALNYLQALTMRNKLICFVIKEPKRETAEESKTVLKTFLIGLIDFSLNVSTGWVQKTEHSET